MSARPIHVGINAQLLSLTSTYRSAGISWYIYHLLRHLPACSEEYRFSAFTGMKQWQSPRGIRANHTRWPTRLPIVRILWEQLAQPLALAAQQVDLLHAPAYVLPAAWQGPAVVTVLDLSFILFPESFRPLNRLYLNLFTRLSVRRAGRVIAISENTRQDAVRLLGLDEQKVQVVYCGVDSSFHPIARDDVAAYRRRKNLPSRFLLFVGTLEPRKNVAGVIEAYHLLRQQWKPRDGELPDLVIGGARGWYCEEVDRTIRDLNLAAHVQFPGYVPAEELPFLYNAAQVFVYPSFYEGFGLPVLEAMACGTPVVTSNRASLPEVLGNAGLTVDPDSVEQLAAALVQILIDDDMRTALGERGYQRAAGFSWDRTARDTLTVYQQTLRQEAS